MTGGADDAAYQAALEYLYTLRTYGTKLGLERMRALLDAVGAPDRGLTFLHIAGTNGKGSTAAMLAAGLQAAGLRVGMYTSPHLVEFTERIQIDGAPIPAEEAYAALQRVRECAERLPGEHATFFEIVTAMAACVFAERGCDVVVWETGLGGRLDATNAVATRASVITTIARDHCQWLGETIAAIAGEKAGIIKVAKPVFTSVVDDEALPVIARVAAERSAPLTVVCPGDEKLPDGMSVRVVRYEARGRGAAQYVLNVPALGICEAQVGLRGAHQVKNGALAAVVGDWFLQQMGREGRRGSVVRGLVEARWPGRLQVVSGEPLVLLDCAHNGNGMAALAAALQEFGAEPWTLVMGVLADKELEPMLKEIPLTCRRIWYVPPRNARAMTAEQFSAVVRRVRSDCEVERVCENVDEMLGEVRSAAGRTRRFVIAGSCYLAGEVLAVSEHRRRDERADDPLGRQERKGMRGLCGRGRGWSGREET